MNLFKKIYTGTLAKYNDAATVKDADSLYMVYDANTGVKSMYKGTQKVAGDFIIVNGGAPANPEKGVIYYISAFVKEGAAEGKPYVGFYNGQGWIALSDSATIEALEERIETLEEWKDETDFVLWTPSSSDRKHIVMANHDSILGTVTAEKGGGTVNLAMVSKWNVADFGSSTIAMNLNAENGIVTINDNNPNKNGGIVAKLSDVKSTVEDLDVDDAEVAGSVVVAVSEEDGKVSNVKKAVAVTKQTTPEANMQVTYDVTIGETSVGKINIPFCDAVLTNAVLTDTNATVDPSNGNVIPGSPKGNDALGMVFHKADNTYTIVLVDITSILVESEFKDGLDVNDHVVSIKLVANNDYLKFGEAAEGVNKPLVANVVTLAEAQDAQGETPAVTGLADALDVKKAIEGKNVTVGTGDEYITPSTNGENEVNVTATDKTKNAVTLAETSVQNAVVATERQEVTVAVEPIAAEGETPAGKKVTIGVTKATYEAAKGQTKKELSEFGLVDAAVLKTYVADEIAKNAVYWDTL